ncbi:hypothetical protein BX666DRAFT_2010907, partial [Dichotomocladium elegans]
MQMYDATAIVFLSHACIRLRIIFFHYLLSYFCHVLWSAEVLDSRVVKRSVSQFQLVQSHTMIVQLSTHSFFLLLFVIVKADIAAERRVPLFLFQITAGL